MRRNVEVKHQLWIDAEPGTVRAQFADLDHHIEANVHPNLRFEVLAQEARRARFRQQVKLLGFWQTDLFERSIDDAGSIHDKSIDGFNKGGTLDFDFVPVRQGVRQGTRVDITIRLQTPPMLGFLAPLLEKQVLRETVAAALQDKMDIETVYKRARAAPKASASIEPA